MDGSTPIYDNIGKIGNASRRICLLVLGMHRSGTSATARVLSLLGAGLPNTIMEAAHGNDAGHWEPRLIQELNDELLHEIGSTWDDWRAINWDLLPTHRRFHFKSAISRIIEEDFGKDPVVVLKEPRICRLTDIYFDVLNELKFDVRVVIPVRNPVAVCASLQKRDGTSPMIAQLYWLRHVLEAERSTRNLPRVFVDFDALSANWRSETDKISRVLGLPFAEPDAATRKAIDSFLDPDLINFRTSENDLEESPLVAEWTRDCFHALKQLEQDRDSETARQEMDRVNHAFTQSADFFSYHFTNLKLARNAAQDRAGQLQVKVEELQAQIGESESQQTALQAEVISATEAVTALEQAVAGRDKLISEQANALDERDALISVQASELDKRADLLALQGESLAELSQTLSQHEASQRAYEKQVSALHREVVDLQKQVDAGRQQLADAVAGFQNSTSWKVTRPLRAIRRLPSLVRERRDAALVRSSQLFNAEWYQSNYADVRLSRLDPALHFVRYGGQEGRHPSLEFDSASYLLHYPDVASSKSNPLVHYLRNGAFEGRTALPHRQDQATTATLPVQPAAPTPTAPSHSSTPASILLKDAAFEALSSDPAAPVVDKRKVQPDDSKLIAFYLPQFHRVIENSEWWAPGFTEWTNVARGRPNYVDHYQPHIPRELGHYDLSNIDVMREQAQMARIYGVSGFCFYHYWFSGRRILEKPVAQFLESDIDMEFCLCWANENWTRTWDGDEKSVLLAQEYTEDDALAFIEDILPALKDHRYIRVDGKPMLVVYRAKHIPSASKWFDIWREYAVQNGLPGLHISVVDFYDIETPMEVGADSLIEFPPHKFNGAGSNPDSYPKITNDGFAGGLVDYFKIIAQSARRQKPAYQLFRGIIPSWDNTARRQDTPTIVVNAEPGLFGAWLRYLRRYTRWANPDADKRLIFMNAWNEWGEGCHLEPDMKWGLLYLEETLQSRFAVSSLADVTQEEAGEILRQDIAHHLGNRVAPESGPGRDISEAAAIEYVDKLFDGPSAKTRLVHGMSQFLRRWKPVHAAARRTYRTLNNRT